MRGSARFITLAAALTLTVSATSFAQRSTATAATRSKASQAASASTGGYSLGYTDIGPVIGLGGIGDAGISFGGRFERAIKELPSLNNGILGIEAGLDWYSYDYGVAGYGLTYIPIGVTANYHFRVESNRKVDPFVGLGLGYYIVNFDCPGACGDNFSNTVYFIGRAGIRYFFQPKIALYADAGSGQGALHVGAMFKLGGK